MFEPFTQVPGQTGLGDRLHHRIDIIFLTSNGEIVLGRIVDHETGPRVPVPGLAYRSRVYYRSFPGTIYERNMGVAKDKQPGSAQFEKFRFGLFLEHVLRIIPGLTVVKAG